MLRRASVKGQGGSHRLIDHVDVLMRYWQGGSLHILLLVPILSFSEHRCHPVHTKGHMFYLQPHLTFL